MIPRPEFISLFTQPAVIGIRTLRDGTRVGGARFPGDGWAAHGDKRWVPWLIDARFRTGHLPLSTPTYAGKNAGYTDWIFQQPCATGIRRAT